MKSKQTILLLVPLLLTTLFLSANPNVTEVSAQTPLPLYFGVDVAFGDIDLTKQLIANVSAFTNFFVIGCSQNYNVTRLSQISDYVYAKGLTFLVFTDDPHYPSRQWLQMANSTYGSQFMGIYFYDEAGGRQVDQAKYPTVLSAANYSDASDKYVQLMSWWLGYNNTRFLSRGLLNAGDYKFFTSDYALFWWDYQSGYDTVFAEFGERGGNWTYSRQMNVALCRGAATVFNKDWGVMITWSYIEPPYMESGPKLYNDMVLAYQNGAKYIVVFDSSENFTDNVLQQEHFDAMQQFWTYAQNNPRTESSLSLQTAAVLPQDYAYGFRGPHDKIWGLWQADDLAVNVSTSVINLLETYGGSLDLVYPSDRLTSVGYREVIPWNSTVDPPTDSPYDNTSIVATVGVGAAVLFVVAVIATLKFSKKPAKRSLP
jgi:hypothetical protein